MNRNKQLNKLQLTFVNYGHSTSKINQWWHIVQRVIFSQLQVMNSDKSNFENICFIVNIFQFSQYVCAIWFTCLIKIINELWSCKNEPSFISIQYLSSCLLIYRWLPLLSSKNKTVIYFSSATSFVRYSALTSSILSGMVNESSLVKNPKTASSSWRSPI